ncbi:sensor histidine kinase [Pedobacter xixiisoli]|uniref:Histidine kinase n=1 Tax=Pedobacter xixiisoli TaxID=1476464 RepID=A0A285ZZS6_9SPHI|nr:histidine kinase [Pedobacter xixiisoli]SOD15153.1 Histidine kinase [Pedobacter xixiisoli]
MVAGIKISLYWKCQLIGWSCAALYWGYVGYTGGSFNWLVGLLQFVSDVLLYIAITHLYRNFALANGWDKLALNALLKRLIFAIAVMGALYTLTTLGKIWLFRMLLLTGNRYSFHTFVEGNGLNILMAGIRLMSIWLLAYHLYHYAIREINIAKENAKLQLLQKDARIQHLSAQLNPHFLFNALNTIKSLITENPVAAKRGIDLLSDLLRSGLYNGEESMVSLQAELNLVADYLEIEKFRFEERLDYHIELAKELAELHTLSIPRLSIQALVENAVKHGISKFKAGGTVSVQVRRQHSSLVIVVSNPGSISNDNPSTGLGLKNLIERISLSYKDEASFSLTAADSKVWATLTLPL